MAARSVSNLAIVLSADTTSASRGIREVQKDVANLGRTVSHAGGSRTSALAGGALGGLLGGRAGAAGGVLGGLIGGPHGAAIGAGIGTAIDQTFGAITASLTAGVNAVKSVVQTMLEVGGEYEIAIATFSDAVGSEEGGRSIFKQLNSLAAATIFSTQELSQQARVLRGYGFEADNLVPTMTKLALVAQRSGRGLEGLQGMTLALSQVKARGHLQGQELRQLTEVGVTAEELAKTLGVSVQAFDQMLHAGEVGYDTVAKTINRMGKDAESLADKLNHTLVGSWNAVKDTGLTALGEVGMGIIKAFRIPDALLRIAELLRSLPSRAAELYPVLERWRNVLQPIGEGLFGGLTAGFEAAKAIAQVFSGMTIESKTIGETLAWGIGSAIDLAIKLSKTLLAGATPFLMVADALSQITLGHTLGLGRTAAMAQAALAAAEGRAPNGFAALAVDAFKKGFPNIAQFKPVFDQTGTNVGAKPLPAAVAELAKTINDSALSGRNGNNVDFFKLWGNLQMAQAGGLINPGAMDAADQLLYTEFRKAAGSLGRLENTLPSAIDKNTVEGQQRIEKVLANMQHQDQDVPGLLQQIRDKMEEQKKLQKQVVDELKKNAPPIPFQA